MTRPTDPVAPRLVEVLPVREWCAECAQPLECCPPGQDDDVTREAVFVCLECRTEVVFAVVARE